MLTVLMSMVGLKAIAYDAVVDGIYYYFSGTEAVVTYNDELYYNYQGSYTGDIVIPSSVIYDTQNYSVTSIGEEAFRNCQGLISIEIPNSVTSIGDQAFFGCSSLTSITIESGNTMYDSRNNCNAIIETATNTLIHGCKSTVIPSSVTSIGDGAFSCCTGLTSITIPNSVTSIGSSAFESCTGLTSITIPNSVTSIGDRAFIGCSSLTSVIIPNSVTSIGDYAFDSCTGLTSITIPNSVTSIGDHAFSGCSSLTSIELPNSVTTIGYDAFNGTTWYNNQPDGLVYAGYVAYKYKGPMPANTSLTIEEVH